IQSATGLISWIPTAAQLGPNAVTVVAEDAANQRSEPQSFVVQVVTDTTPPTVNLVGSTQFVDPGQVVALVATAQDDAGVASLAATGKGTPMALDANGAGTCGSNVPGIFTAVATALDPAGNAGTATFRFSVRNPTPFPPLTAHISSLTENQTVLMPTSVVGTV